MIPCAGLAGLIRLMPPSAGAGVTVDWKAVERAWGLVFPSDFKEFIAHYGGGLPDPGSWCAGSWHRDS